jgi:hypothetical protein
MLCAMRAWLLVAIAGCGPPSTLANAPSSPASPVCGFTDFAAFDREAWQAASAETTRVVRAADTPDPGPISVGSCRLHAIDARDTRYKVRDGERDIAVVTRAGTLLLVPGLAVGGYTVGMSSDVALAKHPPDQYRIGCSPTALGGTCAFVPIGVEADPELAFVVDGDLPAQLHGISAYEFFRHKTLRGVATARTSSR